MHVVVGRENKIKQLKMAVRSKRTPNHLPRPSSLYLDRILNTQRSQARLPTRIWQDGGHRRPVDEGEPLLKLSHPILRALESCAGGATKQFDQVQAQLIISCLFQQPLAAGRAIRKLCCFSPPSICSAISLFSCLEEPDAFVCNTIMKCYVSSNDPESAFGFYRHQMLPRFVRPNHYTFPLLSKLCAELGLVQEGERTHAHVVKLGIVSDLFVQNSLIHMYSSFGNMDSARLLFDSCLESDLVTWNSMINGYVKNGAVEVAHKLFDQMPERDNVSWNVMIAGLSGIGDMEAAKDLFSIMPYRDVVSWNSILDGYAKTGAIALARDLFDLMPDQSLISWNIMLALYARTMHYRECLTLFDKMIGEGKRVRPNEATLVSILTACANLGELARGKWVHSYIREGNGIKIVPDVLLSTALLTMYTKCGAPDSAREVFDNMPDKNIVSWNAMIMGYGVHGQGEKALEVFLEMERIGPRANESTFVCILCACTHRGMVLEGWWCFDRMVRIYGIEPKVEHYGCMVDLLGRAGLLRDSEELVKKMRMDPTPSLLGALLSACRTHSNSKLGEIVSKRLMEIEPRDIGPYVLLSNIYAANGRWDDVENVRKLMREKGLMKAVGISLVGTRGSECEGEPSSLLQHKKRMVYSMLTEMGTQMKSCREI